MSETFATTASTRTIQRYRHLATALISISLISLEIVWTRIFSAEFFYSFAFLILSLAVLALGLGALAVRLFPALTDLSHLSTVLALGGFLALFGPPSVLHLGLDFSGLFQSWTMILRLLLTLLLVGSAFFCGGLALTLLFRTFHRGISRLYMADLSGAALGIVFSVWFMNRIGTPATTSLVAVPMLLAAILCARGWRRLLPGVTIMLCLALLPASGRWIKKPAPEKWPVVHTDWDAMAKIKILRRNPHLLMINVDNVANSAVRRFDGRWQPPPRPPFQFDIDVSYLIQTTSPCRFLSIGAGGGADVLQALQAGAGEIHAVEINPTINRLMTEGFLSDFSGRIYLDHRVRVVTEDARAYIGRHENRFDVILSVSSNTYAALISGAFALAENYLYTVEAMQATIRALSHRGFLVLEHQFYIPRLISTTLEALRRTGVPRPERHIAVFTHPEKKRGILLVSRQPLRESTVEKAFHGIDGARNRDLQRHFPVTPVTRENILGRIVREGWQTVAGDVPIDLSPCTDDRPFISQMGRWKNFNWDQLGRVSGLMEVLGFPLAEAIVWTILAVILLVFLPLNILPYWIGPPSKLPVVAWGYFFSIGAGFMALEVVLIQQFTLLIGPNAYAVMAVLFTLLLGSGLGSRRAQRTHDALPFIAILLWIGLEILLFDTLVSGLSRSPLWTRILVTLPIIFPLGYFMGMPFPKGVDRVGKLVDWGFAVNGTASVLGATAILLVAFNVGLKASLAAGGGLYLMGAILLSFRQRWPKRQHD